MYCFEISAPGIFDILLPPSGNSFATAIACCPLETFRLVRHPEMDKIEWRRLRVEMIEAVGELADDKAKEVEEELNQTDWPYIDRRDEYGW